MFRVCGGEGAQPTEGVGVGEVLVNPVAKAVQYRGFIFFPRNGYGTQTYMYRSCLLYRLLITRMGCSGVAVNIGV